jgi:DNA-binding NtrC family response regulator
MLEESATPLFALDGQRRIVFASRTLGEWVGMAAEQLVGLRCDYHTGGEGPLTSIAAALCPPPEALNGELASGVVGRPALGERPAEQRPARFLRLGAASAAGEALLIVVVQLEQLPTALDGALAPERLHGLLAELRGQLGRQYHISQLIGTSDAARRVREQVLLATKSPAQVLVVGPPGSGREHVARTIHYGRHAAGAGPLVPIHCPLLDSEQMQQALAGVLSRTAAKPAVEPPATLLLDVDRLRPASQQALAGFLELPGLELQTLATARAPLSRLAARGKFRSDLAYGLSTLTIRLPSLAQRRGDIPLLAQHFLEETNATGGTQHSGFQPAALELLVSLPWRGNIDELAAAVREACQRASGPRLSADDFPDWVHLASGAALRPPRDEQPIRLDEFLEGVERDLLERALRKARGNKSKAAELLALSRPRLLRRLVQLGLMAPPAVEEPVVFEPLPEES